jgi:glycosyltransferase involved in cell wall biosynthesis
VVLEAMAMETPIVATDVGGTTELMRSGVDGLAVPAQDAAALAAGIRQVLADPEGSRARAASARRRVEESLSFAARVERMNGIYESLAGRRAGDRRRRAGASS